MPPKKMYTACVVGCSRMGAFIDNEIPLQEVAPMDAAPDEPVSTLGTPMRIKSTDWLPMGHSAAYEACDRVDLVAGCDIRPDVLAKWGERFGVPPERLYTDYKTMMQEMQPDIVSVCTQPEHRAEILIWAAEHGVRALFPEKAFAASFDEAQAVVAAATANDVVVNMGTLRRYEQGYDAAHELIHSGKLGKLKTIIAHSTANLFNGSSHTFDAVNRLNGDARPISIMGELQLTNTGTRPRSDKHASTPLVELPDGTTRPLLDKDETGANILRSDPVGHGIVEYENGVTAYMLNSGRGTEFEAICERGIVSAWNDGETWRLREPRGIHQLAEDQRAKWTGSQFDQSPNLEIGPRRSATLNCIYDLVNALDHPGVSPRGGEHGSVPLGNSELIFGLIESHARGGAKVALPLAGSDHGHWRLARQGLEGNLPRFEREDEGGRTGRGREIPTEEQLQEVVAEQLATVTAKL